MSDTICKVCVWSWNYPDTGLKLSRYYLDNFITWTRPVYAFSVHTVMQALDMLVVRTKLSLGVISGHCIQPFYGHNLLLPIQPDITVTLQEFSILDQSYILMRQEMFSVTKRSIFASYNYKCFVVQNVWKWI